MSASSETTRIAHYFTVNAREFDRIYAAGGARRKWYELTRPAVYRRIAQTAELIQAGVDASVLDVGCGSGRGAIAFCAAGARSVTGIDVSPTMIELARREVEAAGHAERVNLVCGELAEYAPERTWDIVVALGVVEYLKDPRPLLRKMAELSHDRVCFSVRMRDWVRMPIRKLRYWARGCPIYFWTRDDVARYCSDVGIRIERTEPSGAGSAFIIGVTRNAARP
jgi:2-polyprenyl-3-methyl-5-hydroxy-6-metoxy-1,4-benzoquinol methylase